MSTAHRPTWTPAIATADSGYKSYGARSGALSIKDLPGYLKLKTRQRGQAAPSDLAARDLKAELSSRERQHLDKKREAEEEADPLAVKPPPSLKLLTDGEVREEEEERKTRLAKYDDSDDSAGASGDDSSSDSEEDDDEEEEAALMRELEKIKKEREAERLRKEAEAAEAAELEKKEAMLKSNPLLDLAPEAPAERASVKRRWDDDVVFRNQARDEPTTKKRFVNDTVRNDFHRKFLRKYFK